MEGNREYGSFIQQGLTGCKHVNQSDAHTVFKLTLERSKIIKMKPDLIV